MTCNVCMTAARTGRVVIDEGRIVVAIEIAEVPSVIELRADRDEWKRLADLRGDEVTKWADESGTAKGQRDLIRDKISGVAHTVVALGAVVEQLAVNDPDAAAKARAIIDQIFTTLREVRR